MRSFDIFFVEQTPELPVTWATWPPIWRHCNRHPNVIYETLWGMTLVCIPTLLFSPGILITLIRDLILSVKKYGDIRFHSTSLLNAINISSFDQNITFGNWPVSYDTAQRNCCNKRKSLRISFETEMSRNLTIPWYVLQLPYREIFSLGEQQDHYRSVCKHFCSHAKGYGGAGFLYDITCLTHFWPSDAIWRRWYWSIYVQEMALTWTNDVLSSTEFCDVHLTLILQKAFKIKSLKITFFKITIMYPRDQWVKVSFGGISWTATNSNQFSLQWRHNERDGI